MPSSIATSQKYFPDQTHKVISFKCDRRRSASIRLKTHYVRSCVFNALLQDKT